ncbi:MULTISPECIES: amidohydrolase family protein [unclassified Diaminobutyricimonas]|uniref:amidohydrolase n=1 Tax=unclassified Diaminobutyricimonas TaxID=2643261 RepID=UPI0012F4F6A9|nr:MULTISPECIES: amidohydrolase family protein [unclassified Diaminobutyricimonas]
MHGNGSALPDELGGVRRFDIGGRPVLPGLTDGHAHLDRETLGDDLPGFAGASSVWDVLDVIAAAVAGSEPGEWVVTRPLGTPPDYPDADLPFVGRLPDRHLLDLVSPDNPVFIRPIWGFWNMKARKVSFANSMALRLAGITADTPSPHEDLTIVRDARGEPTGMFVEASQQPLIEHSLLAIAPGFSLQQRATAIGRAFERYASFGTTAFYEGHGVAGEVLDAYAESYGAGGPVLRGRLPLSPHWPEIEDISSTLAAWNDRLERRARGFASVDGIYLEASADMRRASIQAANHPRTGWAGFSSGAVVPADRLEEILLACAREGIRVSGITSELLDAMVRVHQSAPIDGLRWTLGHQASLSPRQVEDAAACGIMMTTVTGHNLHRGVYTRDLIGTDRENDIVPVKSLTDAGVPVVLSSDNRPISLWDSVHHVVTREDERGVVVAPDQAVSRYDALRLITVNGAVLTGEDATRGRIRPGYSADLTVLDRNPLECELSDLSKITGLATFVAGTPVTNDGSVLGRSSMSVLQGNAPLLSPPSGS